MSLRALPRRALLLPLAGGAALVGCGGAPTTGDYRSGAADFITSGLDGQAERAGLSFAAATCDEPESKDTGTIFSCESTGSDGTTYTFTVTIVGRNRMDLVASPPLPAGQGGTTVPGSTPVAPATTTPGS